MDYDVIIIGGGPAGLSAALWCDELGMKTLVVESGKEFGGQLLWTHNPIENYLGIATANGRVLRDVFLKQTESRDFLKILQADVKELDVKNKVATLTDGRSFSARAIMIATGIRRKKLNIDGENSFQSKGILSSGQLERDSVKGKTVVIVGGGDAAIENALIFSAVALKVYLVHRSREFRARREFIDKLKMAQNVEILFETTLRKIAGKEQLEIVEIENVKTHELSYLNVDAVLARIGVKPNSDFVKEKLDLDKNGYIVVNSLFETSIKGIFAVGDVSNPVAPTVSSAVGSGATAAKVIRAWLNS